MYEREIEMTRTTLVPDNTRIRELEYWLKNEYIERLSRIERFRYLGLPLPETRWSLECEAYEKENELRRLQGLPELPQIKLRDLI
jgi:DNA-binding transcriptional MerR regulator